MSAAGIEAALLGECEEQAAGRGTVALAAAVGPTAPPLVVHTSGNAEEPAFLAYSITKPLVATVLLRLQEAGRLALGDSLARWLPEVPSAERISLRQLLSHSAGVPDYGGLRSYHDAVRATPREPWSFARFAAETYEKGLLGEPGSRFAYSNPGYMLLRHVSELASGSPFSTLLQRYVTKPLGLGNTRMAEEPDDLESLEPALSTLLGESGQARDVRYAYHPGWVSHGVALSTASELTRFLRALFGGALLTRDSLTQMTHGIPVQQAPPHWRKPRYGLGLMGDGASRWGPLWGHGGGGPGTVAAVFHAPELAGGEGVTACAMCAIEDDPLAERLVFTALDRLSAAP